MNSQEEFLMEKGKEVGDDRAEGSSATGDGGKLRFHSHLICHHSHGWHSSGSRLDSILSSP